MPDELLSIRGCQNPQRAGDVIFVHGLNGNPREYWCHEGKPENYWPAWLGEDLPDVGVWSLGYENAAFKSCKIPLLRLLRRSGFRGFAMPLEDRAKNVLLQLELKQIGERPLVFITHSMGGLLAKQLLRTANESTCPRWRAILERTRGVCFIATPHIGSDLAKWAHYFGAVLGTNVAIDELRPHEPLLRGLKEWYYNFVTREGVNIRTLSFYEMKPLPVVGRVVEPGDAEPGVADAGLYPLGEDHGSICKPKSKEDLIYNKINIFIINDCFQIQNAPPAPSGGTQDRAPLPGEPGNRVPPWPPGPKHEGGSRRPRLPVPVIPRERNAEPALPAQTANLVPTARVLEDGDATPSHPRSTVRYQLILKANREDVEVVLEPILALLRERSGDYSLRIDQVEHGSVKLTLSGTQEGYEILKDLVESGELSEVLGLDVERLEWLGDERSLASPFHSPRDEDPSVRQSAAEVLGRIGPEVVPGLLGLLRDADPDVRSSAAEALGRIGPEAREAVPALLGLLRDADPDVRSSAAEALGRIGPEAVPGLLGDTAVEYHRVPTRLNVMRLGLIADIHADIRALEKALLGLEAHGVDQILCAGDLVGYGYEPDAVVALIRDRAIPCIRGEHDRWALERRQVIGLRGWEPANLSDDTWEFLHALPASDRRAWAGRVLAIYHGSPASDTEFVSPYKPLPESIVRFWEEDDADILVLGHSHIPMIDCGPRGTIINPGSVLGVPGVQTSYNFAIVDLDDLSVRIFDIRTGREIRRDPIVLDEEGGRLGV